ncbi:MAG: hypothetical protein IT206_00955 [Fimbriimonadaceae bacterium]|nr:hypothetical protein [Fimbriimonadaceae bacterium]
MWIRSITMVKSRQSIEISSKEDLRFRELSNEVNEIVEAGTLKAVRAFEDWRSVLGWSRFTRDLNQAYLRSQAQEGTRC